MTRVRFVSMIMNSCLAHDPGGISALLIALLCFAMHYCFALQRLLVCLDWDWWLRLMTRDGSSFRRLLTMFFLFCFGHGTTRVWGRRCFESTLQTEISDVNMIIIIVICLIYMWKKLNNCKFCWLHSPFVIPCTTFETACRERGNANNNNKRHLAGVLRNCRCSPVA